MKILVVDDEQNMRHLLKALVSKEGYMVDTAVDGQDGLDKIKKPFGATLKSIVLQMHCKITNKKLPLKIM